jgi:hypothetical protein
VIAKNAPEIGAPMPSKNRQFKAQNHRFALPGGWAARRKSAIGANKVAIAAVSRTTVDAGH